MVCGRKCNGFCLLTYYLNGLNIDLNELDNISVFYIVRQWRTIVTCLIRALRRTILTDLIRPLQRTILTNPIRQTRLTIYYASHLRR